MSGFDIAMLVVYVAGIFVISWVSSKRIKNEKDMFAAGGQAPWWASGLSSFMTMFSAGTFVVWGGIAYEHGLVAVAINTCYGVASIAVGYWVAGRWNRLGVATPAEYIRLRFGKAGLHFFTWSMLLKRVLSVSVSLYALAVLLVALIPLAPGNPLRDPTTGNLSLTWAVVLFGATVVLYTMLGGLWAVLMTDVLQFIVLTMVVLMVAVLMLVQAPAPAELVERLPDGFFSLTSNKYGWFFLFGWTLVNFFLIGAGWAFGQRFLAVRSPQEARKSAYLFGGMYLVTPLFWLLPPMLYRGVVSDANPEQAYILAAQSVLPVGVMGLMFAAMFSATASMVSSQLNVFAGVLTYDFYHRLLYPGASSRTLVRVGRLCTALLGGLLVFLAVLVPRLGGAEKMIVALNSLLVGPLLAPALWGMFSRRIGLRDMLLVGAAGFGLGLVVRFGFKMDSINVDLLIGVVLPLALLTVLEICRRGRLDRGWTAVEACRQKADAIPEDTGPASDQGAPDLFPARLVAISLAVCGLSLAALSMLSPAERGVIGVFALMMFLLAGVIWLLIRRVIQKAR